MTKKAPSPGVVPLAIQVQQEIRALTDLNSPLSAYPHVATDLLARCHGDRSALDRLLRTVRDITHTPEFVRPDGTILINHRRMDGYAVPPVTARDTDGRLIMSRGLDHLAFAMVCATVRGYKSARTRCFNLGEQVENILALVPPTMRRQRRALTNAIHRSHTMFDQFDRGLSMGGDLGALINLLEDLLNGINAAERAYLDELIERAVA